MQKNLQYWLAAAHAEDITPRQILKCLQLFPDIQSLFAASTEQLIHMGLTSRQINALSHVDWQQVEKSLQWMNGSDCHILTLDDSDYPSLLKEISDPPLVLFVRGDKKLLSAKQIAMVGSRRVTAQGEKNAKQFAAALSAAGFVITSGLALGVDAASHQGALSATGLTIAVMGTGLNYIYPPRHAGLAEQIINQCGVLVSEFLLVTSPKPYHFPRRNRVISGLSLGVLVVEAAMRSGSLVTARHAVEQGREVFAIPGSIHSPVARGCHALIQQGAKLIETAEDVLQEFEGVHAPLQVEFSSSTDIMPQSLTNEEQIVYSHVGDGITPMDEIILRSGLTVSEVSSILLSLELHGHIRAVSGGYER